MDNSLGIGSKAGNEEHPVEKCSTVAAAADTVPIDWGRRDRVNEWTFA